MRHVVLLLLLSACSSAPARHEYRQSAFPVAPAFNPVTDAPHTVGQPGYVGESEDLPRGTDRRHLPQTAKTRQEPGLWSGDAPRASINDPAITPSVLGIAIPLAPEVKTAGDAYAATACAVAINAGVGATQRLQNAVSALTLEQRRCVAAGAFLDCTAALSKRQGQYAWSNQRNQSEAGKERTQNIRDKMKATSANATTFFWKACGDPPSKELMALAHEIFGKSPDPFEVLSPWDL